MTDVMRAAFSVLSARLARETEALINDAITKRLGLVNVDCWKFINRMTSDIIPHGNLIYLDQKELISIQVVYNSDGLEIGYTINHRNYEAPNVN
jgi:hypothetical protein